MVIDINSISPPAPGRSQNNETGKAVPASQTSGNDANTQAPAQDSVELSSTAQELNQIQQDLKNLPEIDETRVEAIRQQISEGSYTVDPAEIAAKIVDDQNFLV